MQKRPLAVLSAALALATPSCAPARAQSLSYDIRSQCAEFATRSGAWSEPDLVACLRFEVEAQTRAASAWAAASEAARSACAGAGAGGRSYSPLAWCLEHATGPAPAPATETELVPRRPGTYDSTSTVTFPRGTTDIDDRIGACPGSPMGGMALPGLYAKPRGDVAQHGVGCRRGGDAIDSMTRPSGRKEVP